MSLAQKLLFVLLRVPHSLSRSLLLLWAADGGFSVSPLLPAPAFQAPHTRLLGRSPSTARFWRTRGCSGTAWWSCVEGLWDVEERTHRLQTVKSGRRVYSTRCNGFSPCSCGRCGHGVGSCWEGRARSLGLGRALHWAVWKGMEAAVPRSKSAPSVRNILAKLCWDK